MRNLYSTVIKRVEQRRDNRRRLDISDDYVNWLCFANPGMLDRGNLYCFDYAIKHLPSAAPILEIGSFCGLSTNLLSYYKSKNGVKNPLITCDNWRFEGADPESTVGDSSITQAEYRTFIKETFIRNVRTFSRDDLPHTVEMSSDDFFQAWRKSRGVVDVLGRATQLGGPIGFCYIDGNHSYEYVRRDFENCDAFLEQKGFILFDDSANSSDWDVKKVIAEINDDKKYELIINNPNYLFMKK